MAKSYRALALQLTCQAVSKLDVQDARASMMRTIERLDCHLTDSMHFLGKDTRLVVLPEYFMTGFPLGQSIPEWVVKAALRTDGPEYEALSSLAQKHGLYLAGNAYEVDEHWPVWHFQTSFVISPAGEVVLRYRRLNSMFAVTPHDIWERYLDMYGLDGVFPVARTEIGALAAIASEEILYPEIARCHALRGAQVFVHCTSDMAGAGPSPEAKEACKVARAVENMAYVVSANSAGIVGTGIPAASADGGSTVIDFRGQVLAKAGKGETLSALAEIDIEALESHRHRPGMANVLARQRLEAYAETYRGLTVYPANNVGTVVPERSHFLRTQEMVIDRLSKAGLL